MGDHVENNQDGPEKMDTVTEIVAEEENGESTDILEKSLSIHIHTEKLMKMCRICGTTDLQHGTKKKEHFQNEMKDLFKIDVDLDDPHIHPNALCRSHEILLQNFATSKVTKAAFRTAIEPVAFISHSDETLCKVCNPIIRRKRKRRGTPKSSLKEFFHAEEVQSKSKVHDTNTEPTTNKSHKDEGMITTHTDVSESENADRKAEDVLKMFLQLRHDEKVKFFKHFTNELSVDELTQLSYYVGRNQKDELLKDCEAISMNYLQRKELLSLNPIDWLLQRNGVLMNFITGMVGEDINYVDKMDKNHAFLFSRAIEYIYSLRYKKLVAPFSFLVTLDIYTKTSSRLAVDTLGRCGPGGMYKTLKQWLSSYGDAIPVCPSGTLITAFDNGQVIGYKRGIGAGSKSLSSVITTIVHAQMHDSDTSIIQTNELFKPKNWFSTTTFDEKLKSANQNEKDEERQERIQTEKDYFIGEVKQIRDSTLPEYNHLEKIHYEQLYYFLSKAIKDVLSEQHEQNGVIVDFVDRHMHKEEREKDIIVCTRCGAENARRKLICECCKQKDGIKEARQKQIGQTKVENLENLTGSKEIPLHTNKDLGPEEKRYEHVPSNHTMKTTLAMERPVFLNPNSSEAVALVLRHIGISCGIKRYVGSDRQWTFICCDGRPHSLYQKLLTECVVCTFCNESFLTRKAYKDHHKDKHVNQSPSCSLEFDWLYMRIGLGHYEMNIIKSFFELNWIPFLEKMCEILKFNTENAKNFAKTCKDHHVAWQLLLVFHTTALKEMMVPFIRLMMEKKETPTPERYLTFFKNTLSSNPRWAHLHLQVFRFSQAIINLRMGIRRNNADLVQSSKFHLKELFYGRSHPHYQSIELFDTMQYHFMPEDVKKVWNNNTSFTVSGNVSRGQDMDFLLEEKNRAVKQFIPSGTIPSEDTWNSICCNLQYIEDLQKEMSSWMGQQKNINYLSKSIDIEDAVNAFRQTLRAYLRPTNQSFDSLSGKSLHAGLLDFFQTSTAKRMNFIDTTVLNQEPSPLINQNEPVYITEDEQKNHLNKLSKADIARKIEYSIEEELEDIILRSHYKSVLQSMENSQMKRDVYLTLYYEVKDIIDSKCARDMADEENVDYDM